MATDCSNSEDLSDVMMEFEGSEKPYSLASRDYTIMLLAGQTKQCMPAIKAAGERIPLSFPGQPDMPLVILGDVFLRRYYTAFDNEDPASPKVGLAPSDTSIQVQDPRGV